MVVLKALLVATAGHRRLVAHVRGRGWRQLIQVIQASHARLHQVGRWGEWQSLILGEAGEAALKGRAERILLLAAAAAGSLHWHGCGLLWRQGNWGSSLSCLIVVHQLVGCRPFP